MKKKQHLGFTLTELMITVAIIGILASIAVPSFQDMIERNRLKEAVEGLKSDLMFARTEAIKRSQNIIVNRVTGNNGTWIYGMATIACDASETDSTALDYCSLKRVVGSAYSQTNLISQSGNTTFTFRRGTALAGNTCFSTANYKLRVKVGNVGRVTVCTNTGSTAVGGYESCPAGQQC